MTKLKLKLELEECLKEVLIKVFDELKKEDSNVYKYLVNCIESNKSEITKHKKKLNNATLVSKCGVIYPNTFIIYNTFYKEKYKI
jgi:hypothetical protein